MASMPTYHVSKGPFQILDSKFGGAAGPFQTAYTDVLNGSGGNPGLGSGAATATLQARTNALGPLTQPQRDHFLQHWMGIGTSPGNPQWWPALMVPDTLRLAMREAITAAKDANLPMEFFWICVQDPIFQIYYSLGPRQVTVLILTPPPPQGYHAGPLTTTEEIWVVKKNDVPDDANYPTVNGTPAGLVSPPVVLQDDPTPTQRIIKQQIWRAAAP